LSIRISLIYSYLDRYASLVISIASSMLIARLLTPEDIGVFSVTMVLLAWIATVRDMGAGGYLVQEKDLTVERIRAVWAVQLGLGLFLAFLVLGASFPVASFYDEPRMRDIMLVVALSYAINPFGSLTYAWQIREMRFRNLAIIRFTSTLLGAIVSVYLAWKGHGPISLAFGALTSTVANALMAIYVRPKWFPWLPGLKEIRRVLGFGSRTTAAAIFNTIAGSAPELLLGKLQGMAATGMYSRANGLVSMFGQLVMQGISSVAISWFAKESREQGDISQPFLKATAYVTALGWAFAGGIIFLAHPVMRILYGEQWDGAVDLARLMAIALAVGLPAAMCGAALMALGAAAQFLRVTVISTLATLIMLLIAAQIGLLAVGCGRIIVAVFGLFLWLHISQKVINFNWSELRGLLYKSAAVGIASGIGPALAFILYGPQPENIWLPMAIGVPGSGIGFLAAIIIVKHPLNDELQSVLAKLRGNKL